MTHNKFEIKHSEETLEILMHAPKNTTILKEQSIKQFFSDDSLNNDFTNKTFTYIESHTAPDEGSTSAIRYIHQGNPDMFPHSDVVTTAMSRIFPPLFIRFEPYKNLQVRSVKFDRDHPESQNRFDDIPNAIAMVLPFGSTITVIHPFAVNVMCPNGLGHIVTIFNLVLTNFFVGTSSVRYSAPNQVTFLDFSNTSPTGYSSYSWEYDRLKEYISNRNDKEQLRTLKIKEHVKVFGRFFPNPPKHYLNNVRTFLGFQPNHTLSLCLELSEKIAGRLGGNVILELSQTLLLIRNKAAVFIIDKEGSAFVKESILSYNIDSDGRINTFKYDEYKNYNLITTHTHIQQERKDLLRWAEEQIREDDRKYDSSNYSSSDSSSGKYKSHLDPQPEDFQYYYDNLIDNSLDNDSQDEFLEFLEDFLYDSTALRTLDSLSYTTPYQDSHDDLGTAIFFESGDKMIILGDNGVTAFIYSRREMYYVGVDGYTHQGELNIS